MEARCRGGLRLRQFCEAFRTSLQDCLWNPQDISLVAIVYISAYHLPLDLFYKSSVTGPKQEVPITRRHDQGPNDGNFLGEEGSLI